MKYRTLTRFWPSLTHLGHTLAELFCLMSRKIGQVGKSLTISARHKQPSLMHGGQRGIVEGQKRVKARYSFISKVCTFFAFSRTLASFFLSLV